MMLMIAIMTFITMMMRQCLYVVVAVIIIMIFRGLLMMTI